MAFDMQSAASGGGFTCKSRILIVYEDELIPRDCNKCGPCFARMKRDRSSRAAAQSAVSAEVVALTLTYREGEAGAYEFAYEDVQRLLYRLRSNAKREAAVALGYTKKQANNARKGSELYEAIDAERARIVYMGCGETGTRGTRRKHWHVNLYFSKPSGWVSSDRDEKGNLVREHRDFWPHGFVTVDVMGDFSTDRRVAAARYVHKYAEKGRSSAKGERRPTDFDIDDAIENKRREKERADCDAAWLPYEPRPRPYPGVIERRERRKAVMRSRRSTKFRFFQSLGKAYGAEWIEKEARRTAQSGLPYHGRYMVPGVNFGPKLKSLRATENYFSVRSLGGKAAMGDPFKPMWSAVRGACIKYAVEAYRDEWRKLYGDREYPETLFMRLNDPEFVDRLDAFSGPVNETAAFWKIRPPRVPANVDLPPLRDQSRCGYCIVRSDRGAVLGSIQVYATGAARFTPSDEHQKPLWLPTGYLGTHISGLGETGRLYVERWLSDKRGPGWLPPKVLRAEHKAREAAAVRAAARAAVGQRDAMGAFAKRAPSLEPSYVESLGPVTGLRRALDRMPVDGSRPSYVKHLENHAPGSRFVALDCARAAHRERLAADLAALPDRLRANLERSVKRRDRAILADPERLKAYIQKRVDRFAERASSYVGRGWLGQRP